VTAANHPEFFLPRCLQLFPFPKRNKDFRNGAANNFSLRQHYLHQVLRVYSQSPARHPQSLHPKLKNGFDKRKEMF
jgi:hypothetical protein